MTEPADDKISARDLRAARDVAERQRNETPATDWGMHYQADQRIASPERLAYEARERGDRWFQIDVPISYVMGYARLGATGTQTVRPDYADVIGKIEDQGWDLQHVSTTFVQRGHASTKRAQMVIATSADDVATHGELVALYVFRRAAAAR